LSVHRWMYKTVIEKAGSSGSRSREADRPPPVDLEAGCQRS
jgi:hypothetical protein